MKHAQTQHDMDSNTGQNTRKRARTVTRRVTKVPVEVFDELESIGAQMSNLCFNLAQNTDGSRFDARAREQMSELQEQWDAARRRFREATIRI